MSPAPGPSRLDVCLGFCSERGARERNEDYVGAWLGEPGRRSAQGVIAAVADGVGGAKGGRVAAEIAVRGVIDGLLGQSEALATRHAAGRAVDALNRWIHTRGRADPTLENMACTLTAAILRGRRLHVLHVGDTRLYRLQGNVLSQLTSDHTHGRPGASHILSRALGAAETVRIDYAEHALQPHDRLLICSDGVHGGLSEKRIAEELGRRDAPEETARRLVQAALASSVGDNATALVLDVLDLPLPNHADLESAMDALPLLPPPRRGAVVDGFSLDEMLADGRYSRVFRGRDILAPGSRVVVLKFPKPGAAAEASFRQAFMREAWIAARVRSPFIGEVLEPPLERRTCLYGVMPFYGSETLERRIVGRPPPGLEAGLVIAVQLCKAVASLHRAGVVHRDIKPDNVLLEPGGLRLLDLGVARLPHLEDFAAPDAPGTPSYMAPELLAGASPGDERSDIFALGVTIYRLFSGGAYPYGEVEAFSRPRFGTPIPLLSRRPDLPAWLDRSLAHAVAAVPEERPADALEVLFELEAGMGHGAPLRLASRSFYDRNPLLFWRTLCAVLALLLLLSLGWR